MSINNKFDVIVSGAGPVGLFFAYQMATRGHSVCIVDFKPNPTEQSRAILLTSRTMEILQARGFAAEILQEAFISSGANMFHNGVVVAQVDANGDTAFPHMTCVAQAVTEKIFYERILQDTNLKVTWNTELISYKQDEQGVSAIIRDVHTKEERVVEAQYIVGSDGTHSRVRKGDPEWKFEGVAIQTKFALADVTLTGKDVDILKEKFNTFLGEGGFGIVRLNPLHGKNENGNTFRVFGNLGQYARGIVNTENPNHGIANTEEPPSLEFVQNWIKEKTSPLRLEASDMIWSSYFKINERIANGYRRERAFLMGDAAHCHSPVGGQGMNLGLQDADNLAWKLSEVLRGTCIEPEVVLDSYDIERKPHALATINATSTGTVAFATSKFYGYCRNYAISTALMIPQLRRYIFRTTMQLWVTLDPSSRMLGVSFKGLLQPGQLLPDSGLLRKTFVPKSHKPRRIQRNTIHELLIDVQQYSVILVSTCYSGSRSNTNLIEKFWKDTRSFPVHRIVVQSVWHSHDMKFFPAYIDENEKAIAEESFYCEERIDLSNSLTGRVGLLPLLSSSSAVRPPSVIVIVRPDLYVADSKILNNETDIKSALQFLSSRVKSTLA